MSTTGLLNINLAAIANNWQTVSHHVGSLVDCAAVVKADAYSMGVAEVAPALFARGCRTFFAATLSEAVELRSLLPLDARLFVLGGLSDSPLDIFRDKNLIPVLYSVSDCARWLDFCLSKSAALACAIKFDTGMTRFGMYLDAFTKWYLESDRQYFLPVLAMSHLACADEPRHELNQSQLHQFNKVKTILSGCFPHLKYSLANSSGVYLGPSFHFDMVRIGAALYGVNPQAELENPLSAVLELRLPVLQLKQTAADASVGYKAQSSVSEGRWLAVVAGGYADGLHRTLGFNPEGVCNGVKVNVVGRVSMDSMVFDVTDSVDWGAVKEISVINKTLSLDYLMGKTNGLGYEVLTSLGRRFNRIYLNDQSTLVQADEFHD